MIGISTVPIFKIEKINNDKRCQINLDKDLDDQDQMDSDLQINSQNEPI